MSELDEVLKVYRDTFGIKSDRANEIHRLACIELAHLREEANVRRANENVCQKAVDQMKLWLGLPCR